MAYQQGFKGVKTMKRSYTDVAVSLLLAGMLAVTGCGGTEKKPVEKPAEKAAAKPASGLTVYTSVYNGMVQEMAKPVVEQQLKDVKVNWQTAGSESVKAKLLDEMKGGRAEAELAEPVDSDGAVTPIRISAMVIAVHNDKIKEPPRSWKDLLDPKYKGKIAMPNPKVAVTALATVAALTDKYGWEYWEKLKANGVIVSKTLEMREKFAHGEYPITITMEENVLKQKAQGVNATVVYPEEGSVLVPGYIGILKDTKNPEGAKKLVDWWLSREGQSAMSLAYMHPVKYGVKEPAGAQKLGDLRIHSLSVNWNKLAVEEKQVKEKFAAIMK